MRLKRPCAKRNSRFRRPVAAVEASVKERRSHEKDVEAQDAHTDKMRARLSELKTNKEYQAHLFELQMANKKKSDIEDKVLACMEKIEQLQAAAKEAQEKVRVAEQAFTKEKQVLDEMDQKLSLELAELEASNGSDRRKSNRRCSPAMQS